MGWLTVWKHAAGKNKNYYSNNKKQQWKICSKKVDYVQI